jgi:hypothetical protein
MILTTAAKPENKYNKITLKRQKEEDEMSDNYKG